MSTIIPTPKRGTMIILGFATLLLVAAAAGDTLTSVASQDSGPQRVEGTCGAVAGVHSDFNTITFAVEAQARAHDSRWIPRARTNENGGPATVPPPEYFVPDAAGMATTVSCEVIDMDTGEVYGRIAHGLPGPTAASAGTIDVPRLATVRARVCAEAIFVDGTHIRTCD